MQESEPTTPLHEKPDPKLVEITVDHEKRKIPKGNYDLVEFKTLVGIEQSKDVDELIDGQFVLLTSERKVHIKGGEVFISHVPQGGSS